MKVGSREAVRWIGAGPTHQLFLAADGALLLRIAPTLAEGAREPLRGPARRLVAILERRSPGLPILVEGGLEGSDWVLAFEDRVGVDGKALLGPLPAGAVLGLGRAMLRALAPLHAEGLFHGALAPPRFVLDPGGAPLLPTVGEAWLAQSALRGPVRPHTPGFDALYTQAWVVPPEVLRARPLSPSSDVFAVAAMVYAWLTGQPAHRGRRTLDVYAALRAGGHHRLATRRPDLPAAVTHALDEALAPDPSVRPSTTELARALDAAAESPGVLPAHVSAPSTPWGERQRHRPPEEAPGPPGSEAEQRRQAAIRQAASVLDARRQGRSSASSSRRNGLLIALAILLGLVLLLPLLARRHRPAPVPRTPAPAEPRSEESSGDGSDEAAITVTVGERRAPAAPAVTRRQPEPEQPVPRRPLEDRFP